MPFFFLPLHGCACVYFPSPLLCLQAINHLHVWLKNTDPGSVFKTFFFYPVWLVCQLTRIVLTSLSWNWQRNQRLRRCRGCFCGGGQHFFCVCGHLPSWKLLWSDYSLERLGAPRLPYCVCFLFFVFLSRLLLRQACCCHIYGLGVFSLPAKCPFFSFMTLMAAKPSAFAGRSFPVACVATHGPSFTASRYLY